MRSLLTCVGILLLVLAGCGSPEPAKGETAAPPQPVFGTAEDVEYATALWEKMAAGGFNGTEATPVESGAPHGDVVEVLQGEIDGMKVIVKRNYGGEGVGVEAVAADRAAFLVAVTVMAKREAGYDPENGDWFWVKYKADGSIETNPRGVALAGRVAKGMDKGCIACHQGAADNDLVFTAEDKITMLQ